jgi:hypothetical protein
MLSFCFVVATTLLAAPQQDTRGSIGVYRMPDDLAREIGIDLGAGVLHVVPRSPADKVGIKLGDAVVAVNGERVADFDEMANKVGERNAGDKLTLDVKSGSNVRRVDVTLVKRASEMNDAGYRASLDKLKTIKVRHEGPARVREIADVQWNLGFRAEALKTAEAGAERFKDSPDLVERRLEYLSKNGRLSEYVRRGLEIGKEPMKRPSLRLHHVDALLASNKDLEAEKEASVVMSQAMKGREPTQDAVQAYQAWVSARLRQRKPLSDRTVDEYLARIGDQRRVKGMTAWRDLLNGAPTYQRRSPASARADLEYEMTGILFGLIPERMNGISLSVNGVKVPLSIVDTGASHTLIHDSIAEKGNVESVGARHGASGSLNFSAKPGLVRELKIGDIVLANVPVNIGDPPPLVMTKAKAALGVDLMHHLEFSIDYLKKRVTVRPAGLPPEKPESPGQVWDIPLFPFAEHTLSEGTLPSGAKARVLIDSGNFAYTLLWPVWGKSHVAGHKGPVKGLFEFATSNPSHSIIGLTLGGRKLPDWPVMDMPPVTLQGVDLLDLLMGNDLLSQYVVTIDMRGRRLRLRSHADAVKPPVAPKGL